MFSFLLLPTFFYFSYLITAAAAALPTLTNTPQLPQPIPVKQPNSATVSSLNNTSSNRFFTWNIPNTRYDIYIISIPPFVPNLRIVPLSEVYILAMNECHVKIAQGFGGDPSENLTFTSQNVQLDWKAAVASATSATLNYYTLLQVFVTLVDLNVRQSSPLPELIAKDLFFTVAHRNERRYTGNGLVNISDAGNEVLAKRSLIPSPAPQLLQAPASEQDNTTNSLSFNATDPNTVFEYVIPSTPYVLVIHTYSLWSLLQREALEVVYNRTLTRLQEYIDHGRGGYTPQSFKVVHSPIQLIWRADVFSKGLNYSMLSIVFGALQRLHTDPAPSPRAIFRRMIYYDIFEQIGAQRFELGEGQVDSIQAISKRQSVNTLHKNYAYQIPSTPYHLLVTAYSDPLVQITSLQEVYSIAISALEDEIAQGRGAAKPVDITFQESPVVLTWTQSDERTGLNHTDLSNAFKALKSIHVNCETPWHERRIWYNIVVPNAEQESVTMGGGMVEDLLEIGPSKVSVQTSKRSLVDPANPLPSYVFLLPNTPYILNITIDSPSGVVRQLPVIPLLEVYDIALHDFAREIWAGRGGDVPANVEIDSQVITLGWIRDDPPGLNYSMLRRVYQLLEVLQTNPGTPFQEGYRMGFFFHVVTTDNDSVGAGLVTSSTDL